VTGHRGAFNRNRDRAAEALRMAWGADYDIGIADDAWRAARLDGAGDLLTGAVPDEVAAAIRADWGAWNEEGPR
jgi:hypothetical protein